MLTQDCERGVCCQARVACVDTRCSCDADDKVGHTVIIDGKGCPNMTGLPCSNRNEMEQSSFSPAVFVLSWFLFRYCSPLPRQEHISQWREGRRGGGGGVGGGNRRGTFQSSGYNI